MTEGDSTRRQVEGLYQEHPYPDHGVVGSTVARLARSLVRGDGAGQRILDAGCGTGEQTLGLKRAFPRAEVIGADINPTSLDRARVHAARQSTDVRFESLDLLAKPPSALGSFDVITSVGVLHHLPEPAQALENLRRITQPDGALLGMVYGRYGKWPMFRDRDGLSALAASSDRDARLGTHAGWRRPVEEKLATVGLDLLRRRRFGPDLAPLELVRRAIAGRNRSFVADSYAHAHELSFTWSEIGDLLGGSGWHLTGWPQRSGMPDDPGQLFSGEALERARRLDAAQLAHVYELLVRPSNLYFLARPAPDAAG